MVANLSLSNLWKFDTVTGHRKSDFDFCHCMSQIFPPVTSIRFYILFTHPKAMPDANV